MAFWYTLQILIKNMTFFKFNKMKMLRISVIAVSLIALFISSCKKDTTEKFNLSKAKIAVVNAITNTTLGYPNPDSIKAYRGTLLANTTYNLVGNIVIPRGDTLFVQSGVTVCVENGSCINVQGVLISLGTQSAPNWFTRCGRPKTDNIGQSQATDSAWSGGSEKGIWVGIECDTSCRLLVLKWTHIEFVGAGANHAQPISGVTVGATNTNFGIWFQNPNGCFIMEDSWEYGTQDDAIRVSNGKFDIMRNFFEKTGYIGGDCNNMKSGSIGDCAYNLYIGCATNGSKASNKGAFPSCNYNMYNNTYINSGFRQNAVGRGANIDYEQGAQGSAYNNLIVDCKVGFRVVGTPVADTLLLYYGNNFVYGDSTDVTTQFYPVGYITRPNCYVVPDPAVTGYVYTPAGAAAPTGTELADDMALNQANNPMFVNFPLPENPTNFPGMSNFWDINNDNALHGYDFHLKPGSPAIGVGNPSASYMLNACASITNPLWGPNESAPCIDIGCYPTLAHAPANGGNQHINGEN
jgi:hypothetical protein